MFEVRDWLNPRVGERVGGCNVPKLAVLWMSQQSGVEPPTRIANFEACSEVWRMDGRDLKLVVLVCRSPDLRNSQESLRKNSFFSYFTASQNENGCLYIDTARSVLHCKYNRA